MKKFFVIAVFAALFSMAACNEIDTQITDQQQREISFLSMSNLATKVGPGTPYYVNGQAFKDSAGTDRQMWVSAFVYPQYGSPATYFEDELFKINANGETDNMWHHTPKVWWPMGGRVHFLAYSANTKFAATKYEWDPVNPALRLDLTVESDRLQDDILYAAKDTCETTYSGSSSYFGEDWTGRGAAMPMRFYHSQAWIQFKINASVADVVTLNNIMIQNLYTDGKLSLYGGVASLPVERYGWDFTTSTGRDFPMQDVNWVLDTIGDGRLHYITALETNPVDSKWQYMDMLIPQQDQTSFTVEYGLGDYAGDSQDHPVFTYFLGLNKEQWVAGKKYIYEITIRPTEIIIKPSVEDWVTVLNQPDSWFPAIIQ